MPKQKSRNKKISNAMKKRWAAKKNPPPTPITTSDASTANLVNSSFSGVAVRPEQQRIFIRIHRPDDSLITIEH